MSTTLGSISIRGCVHMQVPEDNTLYPALSAERMQQVTANFGYSPFRYCTRPPARPLAWLPRVISSLLLHHRRPFLHF
jgi:hypothetical protein